MDKGLIGRGVVLAMLAGGAVALARPGPDVTLSDIGDTTNYGLVGGIRGYAIGSNTCNIGNVNLLWLSSGTPGLAMNGYRLYNGRLTQIGMSWAKTACCAAAGTGPCGTCNGAGGNVLGVGCLDVYSAGWNGGQTRLGPRYAINAYSGAFQSFPATSGDAIYRRLQIAQADLSTTAFEGAQFFVEGVYVGSDDAASGNWLNNATYKRVTVNQTNFNLTVAGAAQVGIPAIRAWRDHGLGANVPDPSVTVGQVTVPAEGTFWFAHKAKDLGNGSWRYEYAVFNLNSDRSGGSFSVPVPAGVNVSNVGFSAPLYHSGEPYSNAPWVSSVANGAVTWQSPETFQQNINSNALRWGTMYNFWFDASTAPTAATATLGLFKPFTPASVTFAIQGPTAGTCYPNCDGSTIAPILNVNDFQCFINSYAAGDSYANCDGSTTAPVLNVNDFVCFQQSFATGCR